jgi:hypothetical protein
MTVNIKGDSYRLKEKKKAGLLGRKPLRTARSLWRRCVQYFNQHRRAFTRCRMHAHDLPTRAEWTLRLRRSSFA